MEKKKHSILNVFDLVVIALIVVLAVVLFIMTRPQPSQSQEDAAPASRTIRYTVEFAGMQNGTAELIKAGDVLLERGKLYDLGTIESVTVSPTTYLNFDYETNEYKLTEMSTEQTVVAVVVAACTENDRQILIGGKQEIKVGGSYRFNGPGYYSAGTVIGIER
ncbi:MAG: DUF4330 family protein [Oscillospiraceae bacterium]|nr:DUF4330 family protein [Oscillospiraceae bacterium]